MLYTVRLIRVSDGVMQPGNFEGPEDFAQAHAAAEAQFGPEHAVAAVYPTKQMDRARYANWIVNQGSK